ncbi:MAG TPA: hypothetical protein VIU61_10265, partial [Kofleriaceae bacterium]
FEWQGGLAPGAYFPDVGDHRLRPMSGVRVAGTDADGRGGPLVIFLAELDHVGGVVGTRAVRITNLPAPPAEWIVEPLAVPPPSFALDAAVGSCGVVDGDHYVALSVDGPEGNARVVRWPLASLAAGDLATREWHTRDGWRTEAALVARPPEVFQDASIHCSFTRGLSGTTYEEGLFWTYMQSDHHVIVTREAREPFGPYSLAYELLWIDANDDWSREADMPVISAQHHAGLKPASYHGLATYVPTSTNPDDLLDPVLEHTLHWPHFLRLMPVVTAVE